MGSNWNFAALTTCHWRRCSNNEQQLKGRSLSVCPRHAAFDTNKEVSILFTVIRIVILIPIVIQITSAIAIPTCYSVFFARCTWN
jgi:hypothetical protein